MWLGSTVLILFIGICIFFSFVKNGPSPYLKEQVLLSLLESDDMTNLVTKFFSEEEIQEVLEKNQFMENSEPVDETLITNSAFAALPSENSPAAPLSSENGAGYNLPSSERENSPGYVTASVSGSTYAGSVITIFPSTELWMEQTETEGEQEKSSLLREGILQCPAGSISLIRNGIMSKYTGLSSGCNMRLAVGQKSDGTLIVLYIPGHTRQSIGATYADLIEIMQNHGAIQAFSLASNRSLNIRNAGEVLFQYEPGEEPLIAGADGKGGNY
ncbi:MAG: phosphodiester glycosidase family protein [Lachnospiraceae bacterium]